MQSKTMTWVGWILGGLPALMLLASAAMKFSGAPGLAEGFGHLGWPVSLAVPLGILEITVTLLYLIPQTSVLGAILLTGYMGGAIATHVRVGDPFFMQILLGVAIWGGLYLREPRLRSLIPLKS
ncbi:MAG: DoxX family protein [Bryobacteraceae bacterium]|nr:DoxX family protein [Bryobacteraceae bacterium]